MTALEPVRYSTFDLPEEQGFEAWRTMLASQYRVARAEGATGSPRGAISMHPLGDIVASRSILAPQFVERDRRLISGSPDHLLLLYWNSGGSRGEVDGVPVVLRAGQAVLANRRRPVSARWTASDTAGLVVPRTLLHGIDVDRFDIRLDPLRDRLAAARITGLFRELPRLHPSGAGPLGDELLGFLRRLLDPSSTPDVLDGMEFDASVAELARRTIDRAFRSLDLTPEVVADRIQVSRATLYRAFAAEGGLMRVVWNRRLDAAASALADPLERRPVSRIAADAGFKTLAHMSRAFRARHGLAPRDWRRRSMLEAEEISHVTPASFHRRWTEIKS